MGDSSNSVRREAIRALTAAMNSPAPRVQFGSKGMLGFLQGNTAKTRPVGQLMLSEGWIEPTGESVGKGKSRKPLFRVSAAGLRVALAESDVAMALEAMAEAAQASRRELAELTKALEHQTRILDQLRGRIALPDLDRIILRSQDAEATRYSGYRKWLDEAVTYVSENPNRHPLDHVPLPDLFRAVGEPHGLTIGAFHDGLRTLLDDDMIRLEPYTGPMFQLEDGQYALMWGQEVKYYAVANR